jgi:hypothetical protein
LVERLVRNEEVSGSIPLGSTRNPSKLLIGLENEQDQSPKMSKLPVSAAHDAEGKMAADPVLGARKSSAQSMESCGGDRYREEIRLRPLR